MRTGGPDRSSARRAPTPERGAAGDRAFDEPTPFWRSPTPIAVVSGLAPHRDGAGRPRHQRADEVLTVFLGCAPLVASAALGPAGTAIIATARAAVSGLWNHTLASPTGDTDQGLGRSILGV